MLAKFITPEEQKKNRKRAQTDANHRALNEIGQASRPSLTLKLPVKYSEPADVIDMDERRKKE